MDAFSDKLVGMSSDEIVGMAGTTFFLYRRGRVQDPHDSILADTHVDILALLGINNLDEVKEVACKIRSHVSKSAGNIVYWGGSEGWVLGTDLKLIMESGETREIKDVFLLKIFKEDVIHDHATGVQRLKRTEFLCNPEQNLHRLANLARDDKLRFAGAPILSFCHHLEQANRKKKDEEYICYIMKDAALGISLSNSSAHDKTITRTWKKLRNERPLSPRDRIALACDLAGAVGLLQHQHIQHCDSNQFACLFIIL